VRTIVKRGSVELKTVAELDRFLSDDDNCVLGTLSREQLSQLCLCCFLLI